MSDERPIRITIEGVGKDELYTGELIAELIDRINNEKDKTCMGPDYSVDPPAPQWVLEGASGTDLTFWLRVAPPLIGSAALIAWLLWAP